LLEFHQVIVLVHGSELGEETPDVLRRVEEEPGIRFDANTHRLQMCWTVRGDEDFRLVMEDLCMNLNELSSAGTPIEVTFYDTEFDDEDEHNRLVLNITINPAEKDQ
jgi:hypothetical protein